MYLPGRRDTVIIASVALAHGLALWSLNKALLGRPLRVVTPATIMAEIVTPAPAAADDAPDRVMALRPAPAPSPRAQPAAATLAVADARLKALRPLHPAPLARTPMPAPQAPKPVSATQPSEAVDLAPQMPEVIVRPASSPSDSLNPAPLYPAASVRLNQAGRVVVRALIGPAGRPQQVLIQRSSGFERLDQISLDTVRDWRFDPAVYRGRTETQWIRVPINFVLQ